MSAAIQSRVVMGKPELLLTHYEHGRIWVHEYDDASWWMRKRQWSEAGNEERGTFDDGDFEESVAAIDAALDALLPPAKPVTTEEEIRF